MPAGTRQLANARKLAGTEKPVCVEMPVNIKEAIVISVTNININTNNALFYKLICTYNVKKIGTSLQVLKTELIER